ncbi:Transmembrane protein [Thalictrum thalictroides]|uniref:Transmembrane protein n=1 Tax=Thalictrum thalictroides TaxID=46969 RepID=A0A7J6WM96_THATH|nr:Transmembrane protein [Thalictrum thalictroides]
MAAAEARAAWQRTANRYFVQEDAKRAPKLACCPSASSSSKSQVDVGPGDATNGPEHPSAGFVPLNWNPSNSNLSPDTKWWLQLQPNYGHQRDLMSEQLNVLEVELSRNEETKIMTKIMDQRESETCMKQDSETMSQQLPAADCDSTHKTFPPKNFGENWYQDEELMDIDPANKFISKQPEKPFGMDSPWIGDVKSEPWWRTADKDELASLVAQKSLEHVENCDLPPPQIMHVRSGPFARLESFKQDGIFSSFDRMERSGHCNSVDHSYGCLTCDCINGKQWGSGEKDLSYGFDKSFSSNNHSTYSKDPTDARNTSESEPSKAQLMEALCHSQTRAREAEDAAQKAYDEKEHIIKLFFKQASHLFAYKQWLQILQLETICLQLKNNNQSISTLFPVFLPWMPSKGRQWKKGKNKAKKTKSCTPRCGICRYAVAFAVGLGLAGAGLLLGWTMVKHLPSSSSLEAQGLSMESVISDLALADGVTPSSQQWEFSCDLEVDYGSDEIAQIVCSALSVDKELQPDKVKRNMSVSQGKLSVHFEAVEARFLRASYSTFLDIVTLATKTIEEFGSGIKL